MKKRTKIISALFAIMAILCLTACNGSRKESPEEIKSTIMGYIWKLSNPAGGIFYDKEATYRFCDKGILRILSHVERTENGDNIQYEGKWTFDKKDISLLIEFEYKGKKKRIRLVDINTGWNKLDGKIPDYGDDIPEVRIFTARDADTHQEFVFKHFILWS